MSSRSTLHFITINESLTLSYHLRGCCPLYFHPLHPLKHRILTLFSTCPDPFSALSSTLSKTHTHSFHILFTLLFLFSILSLSLKPNIRFSSIRSNSFVCKVISFYRRHFLFPSFPQIRETPSTQLHHKFSPIFIATLQELHNHPIDLRYFTFLHFIRSFHYFFPFYCTT